MSNNAVSFDAEVCAQARLQTVLDTRICVKRLKKANRHVFNI